MHEGLTLVQQQPYNLYLSTSRPSSIPNWASSHLDCDRIIYVPLTRCLKIFKIVAASQCSQATNRFSISEAPVVALPAAANLVDTSYKFRTIVCDQAIPTQQHVIGIIRSPIPSHVQNVVESCRKRIVDFMCIRLIPVNSTSEELTCPLIHNFRPQYVWI